MIELTVRELIESIPALQEINNKEMPAKVAYQFARIIREVDKENQIFQEARRKLIDKYGVKDEDGKLVEDEKGNISIANDKIDEFNKEVNDLLEEKISLNCSTISVEMLSGEFSPTRINNLIIFLNE